MKRKILSILLCIAVCITMMPVAAYAADSTGTGENAAKKAAIQLGTSGISGPTTEHPEGDETKTYYEPTSYIYFGQNNGTEPIKWRVLRADKANNGVDGMFLLSEYLLDSLEEFSSAGTNWQGSAAQNWCKQFVYPVNTVDPKNRHFSNIEQKTFLSVTKTDQATKLYNISWDKSSLDENGEQMFFLSVSELADYVGDYAPKMKARFSPTNSPSDWWLRSPSSGGVGFVPGNEEVRIGAGASPKLWKSARPAFNLDLNQVLLTSAAVNGKPTGTLATVGTNDTKEWKLTLRDSSRDGFTISNVKISGEKASFSYTNAKTNPTEKNEYLSAIIVKNGAVSYYGHLLQLDAEAKSNGTATVTIPEGVTLDANTQLLVFNEQCNGDKKTDYASELKIVQQEITEIKATITNPKLGATPAGTAAVTFKTTPDTSVGSVTNPEVTWYKVPKADYVDGKGSDSWEEMENDEVFKSDFCYSVAITADIPSGYVLSPDVTGFVNDKSHGTSYSRIDYNKESGKFYIRVDFDPALVAIDHQLYYNAKDGKLYIDKDCNQEYNEQKNAWSSSKPQGSNNYDTLELHGFSFVTDQDVALKIVGMDNNETFTIKETSGALEPDPAGGLRITGGSLIAGAGFGISTNSKLTIDGGVLLATGTQSGYAIKADGDILLKNTTLVDSLATYKISPSLNGIHTNGTLNIENAYVRAGKITTATGIYVRECIEVRNLWVTEEVNNKTDSKGQPVAKEVSVSSGNHFLIDGRWRVIFDSNGGNWKENEVYPVTKDQFVQFPANDPAKDGYTFNGWFTSENGGTEIKDHSPYTLLTSEGDCKLSPQSSANGSGIGGRTPTLYAHWKSNTSGGGSSSGGSSSGGGSYTPVQKPDVQPVSGGKTELSKDGSTLEITPDEGMEIGTVTVNGKEVTVKDGKLTGLKTGDKVEITFIAKAPTKAENDKKASAKVKKLSLKVKTAKDANKNIKATVQTDKALAAVIKELKAAGYTVKYKFYRSEKKASDYKRMLTKNTRSYLNTTGSEDTHYYYKVRLAIYDKNGKLVAQTALKQCDAGHRTWTK